MKRTILNIALLAALATGLTACEKAFYMPDAPIQTTTTNTDVPVAGVDVAKLNLVWIEPTGTNANEQGIKFEIYDKTNTLVYATLAVRAEGDAYFRTLPNVIVQPEVYTFVVRNAAGNIINEKLVDFAAAFKQDEYIVNTVGINYYLQMTWQKLEP